MATWKQNGLDVISDKAIQNVRDLRKIVQWNIDNGYKLFRVGSELIPWIDHYDITKLKDFEAICIILADIGDMARNNDIRLTAHPGQYRVLCSPNQDVVERTIRELQYDSFLFDLMGYEPSHYNKINIHIGGAYGDKKSALDRWITNWKRLDENTKKRVVVENDDRTSLYSVKDLMYVHEQIGIPITFDYYHHSLHPDGLTEQEALEMAMSTWPKDIVPCTHYSECRRDEQQKVIQEIFETNNIDYDDLPEWPTFKKMHDQFCKTRITAHSDYIEREIKTYGHKVDVMVEAKAKELATERYKEMYINNPMLITS
jgi:UV DNA damage endonuclease